MISADLLHEPADLPPAPSGMAISNLMHLIWRTRPDLQAVFDLEDAAGRERFIAWYKTAAPREYRIPAVLPTSGQARRATSDLLYSMKSLADRASHFGRWLPLRVRRQLLRSWTRAGIALSHWGVGRSFPQGATKPLPGVNLVGYANGMLSLGEHLRMTARAFATTNCDFNLIDYRNGARNRQQSEGDRITGSGRNRLSVNLFHINADQMLNAYCHFGHGFFQGRYNIGFWAWELEQFPAAWVPVIDLLDEIWAPSRFVQESLQLVTDKPVTLMPQCVEIPPFDKRSRSHFGLPEQTYLFIFAFDFLSYIDRKNPLAAIRAFKMAFSDQSERTGLVLKVMNGDEGDQRWQEMLLEIAADCRISIINEAMSRSDSLALMDCCDCFVSLHRSEGFGRGPAEAMLLGKPVIVTGYSGNLDYTFPDNSFLVDYTLIPVRAGQYIYAGGQLWADPDVEHAAIHMRSVYTDREEAGARARQGEMHVREHLSAKRIGELMAERLATVGVI